MTHFATLVITDSEDEVDDALAPYHEFECTGMDDEYVVEVDETEEARDTYNKNTTTCYIDPDGEIHDWTDPRFIVDRQEERPHGSVTVKTRACPEGWREEKLPTRQLQSFGEFVECYYGYKKVPFGEKPDLDADGDHKYGYYLVDENDEVITVYDRTNPNARWDWYVIGGRYSHRLFKKSDKGPISCNSCKVSELDLDALRAERQKGRRNALESAAKRLTSETGVEWDFEKLNAYWREEIYPAVQAEFAKDPKAFGYEWQIRFNEEPESFAIYKVWRVDGVIPYLAYEGLYDFYQIEEDNLEDWINNVPALSAWAVVKNGEWFEKGKMGWWASSSNEMSDAEWDRQFDKMMSELRPDQHLTVVDCHT